MIQAECPDCGEVVQLRDGVRVGDRVICAECGVELEVLSIYPWELDYAMDEEDGWDDDDDLDDDDPWEDE